MPFINEHACRIVSPDKFQSGSFRRIHKSSNGKSFDIIIGRLKGKKTTTTQAHRYPIKDWNAKDAQDHCKANDGILFEKAKNSKEKSADCIECNDIQSKNTFTPDVPGKNKIKNKEGKMPNLKELLADNPGAQAEYDVAIVTAENSGMKNGEKKINERIKSSKNFLANKDYPESISALALKVMTGEVSDVALVAAVTAVDATIGKKASDEAKDETTDQGETPAGSGGQISDSGICETEEQFQAELARSKEMTGGA